VPAGRRERLYAWTTVALVAATWATLYWVRFVSEWLRARGWLTAVMIGIFVVAALAVLAAYAVSAARARSRPRPLELFVLAFFAALYAAAVLPLMGRPEEALHFVQYGAVGGFAYAALAERRRRLAAEGTAGWLAAPAAAETAAFLATAAAGWIDEGIQHLLPNRYYDLRDVAFNAAAGALAIAALASLRWARRGRPSSTAAPPPDASHG
jgi:VanZ family protein